MASIFSSEHTITERIQAVSKNMFNAFTEATNTKQYIPKVITLLFLNPTRRLKLIGVTGTNGKSTTAYLIHQALQNLGESSGMIGTVDARIGHEVYETHFTTPKPFSLNILFNKMIRKNCRYCVMEVSSIGLVELRVSGLDFEAAIFTNLTHDHLEYHKTFVNYIHAKSLLFRNLKPSSPIIANRDDKNHLLVSGTRRTNRYSFGKDSVDDPKTPNSVTFELLNHTIDGLTLKIDGQIETFKMIGEHNAYNIAAAYTTLISLGFSKKKSINALADTNLPAGRVDIINPDHKKNDEPIVLIDFAHTPDAMENLLTTVNTVASGRYKVITVFGCSGGRGIDTRHTMGSIAEKLSDYVFITSKHSKNENPQMIVKDILKGFTKENCYTIELDRKKAIRKAIEHADSNSIVVLAGMGHYDYQEARGVRTPHNDKECALKALRKNQN